MSLFEEARIRKSDDIIDKSVKEIIESFMDDYAREIGFDVKKNPRKLKKTVGDMEFEIAIYSSKYNKTREICDIQYLFVVYYKQLNSDIKIVMRGWGDTGNFHEIETYNKYEKELVCATQLFEKEYRPIIELFENDFNDAVEYFSHIKRYSKYNVSLQFLDQVLGRERIEKLIKKYYKTLSLPYRRQIESYAKGERELDFVLEQNGKYILDNKLIDF